MTAQATLRTVNAIMRWAPGFFLTAVCIIFGLLSPQFLTWGNCSAILAQSSWLTVVALGMNLVLLTGGVDLSVGSAMFLGAIAGSAPAGAPIWLAILAAVAVGTLFGGLNGLLVVRVGLPPFVATLATTFIGRGLGLYVSATRLVIAGDDISKFGRGRLLGLAVSLWFAVSVALVTLLAMRMMEFGPFVRAIGADREGARRVGVPVGRVLWTVYALCGAFAGLGGFVSLAQTASASPAFGVNAEFLAIAAAVLGGTSLFGGRGGFIGPILGAILIMTVQNGMALINANPYAYPVTTGMVIFVAVALDTLRTRLAMKIERRRIRADEPIDMLVKGEGLEQVSP